MIRNLKVLGLALVAVFALSAMVASAASAANGRLTSTGPVTLSASENAGQVNALTAFNGTTTCPGSVITGHNVLTQKETEEGKKHGFIVPPAETVTLTPDYVQTACNVVESGVTHKATVTMNECDYVLHLGVTNGVDTYNSTVDVVCPATKSIILDVYFASGNETVKVCEITVGAQTGLAGATVTDNTNGTIGINGTYTGISASKSGTCGAGSTTTGEFDIHATASGKNELGTSTAISLSHL